jgi:hypothetical protein
VKKLEHPLTAPALLREDSVLSTLTVDASLKVLNRSLSAFMIEAESINPFCQYQQNETVISAPAVRGKHCIHFQCFDLKIFLGMNQGPNSKFKCP